MKMEPQAEEEVGGKPSCSFLPRKKKAVMPAIGTFLTSVVIFLKSAFMRRSILEKGVLKRHTTRDQVTVYPHMRCNQLIAALQLLMLQPCVFQPQHSKYKRRGMV